MSKELKQRLIYGPLMAALAIGCIWADHRLDRPLCTAALVLTGITLGLVEYRRMLARVPIRVDAPMLFFWALVLAALPLSALLPSRLDDWMARLVPDGSIRSSAVVALGICTAVALVTTVASHMFRRGVDAFFRDAGATVLGILYLGVLPFFITLLLCRGPGIQGVFLFLTTVATCKLGDVFAFGTGKLIGRHKLIPRVSPGKTWEGFAGSLGGAVLAAWLCVVILRTSGQPPLFRHAWSPVAWGLIIGPVGVFGDLFESVIKRSCGVKDSGATIPGFGGFLDVFDAVIPAGLAATILVMYL